MITMSPLATKIGELLAELELVRSQVAKLESSNRPKLHPQDVREIRVMWDNGYSQRDIADTFGINRGTVSGIITGKYHKGVS